MDPRLQRIKELVARDRQVLRMASAGVPKVTIARELDISRSLVYYIIRHAAERSRAQA